jgi:hypothetical protein
LSRFLIQENRLDVIDERDGSNGRVGHNRLSVKSRNILFIMRLNRYLEFDPVLASAPFAGLARVFRSDESRTANSPSCPCSGTQRSIA